MKQVLNAITEFLSIHFSILYSIFTSSSCFGSSFQSSFMLWFLFKINLQSVRCIKAQLKMLYDDIKIAIWKETHRRDDHFDKFIISNPSDNFESDSKVCKQNCQAKKFVFLSGGEFHIAKYISSYYCGSTYMAYLYMNLQMIIPTIIAIKNLFQHLAVEVS